MQKVNSMFLLGVLAVCVCILGTTAMAVVVPQSTEQLVENSSDVIRGKVVTQSSQWDDAHTLIYTEVIIDITEILLGSMEQGATVTVYVPGGIVNDTGLMVEHAPEFNNGEDVIVFLTELNNLYSVTSWEMGKFTVEGGSVNEKQKPVTEFINAIKAAKQ